MFEKYITDLKQAIIGASLSPQEKKKLIAAADFAAAAQNFLRSVGHTVSFTALPEPQASDSTIRHGSYMPSLQIIELPMKSKSKSEPYTFSEEILGELPFTLAHESLHAVDHYLGIILKKQILTRGGDTDTLIAADSSTYLSQFHYEYILRKHDRDFESLDVPPRVTIADLVGIAGVLTYKGKEETELVPRVTEYHLKEVRDINDRLSAIKHPQHAQLVYRVLSGFAMSLQNAAASYKDRSIAEFASTVLAILEPRRSSLLWNHAIDLEYAIDPKVAVVKDDKPMLLAGGVPSAERDTSVREKAREGKADKVTTHVSRLESRQGDRDSSPSL